MKRYIEINTSFIGWHRWAEAPDNFEYLRNYHRHVFHVRIMKEVKEANREIEFINFKSQVDAEIARWIGGRHFELSCEQIAEELLKYFGAASVKVTEDGENGGLVTE